MGVTTQCCVQSTMRSAVDLGYRCLTVEDCCAAEERSLHDNAISLIYGENHLFGWVTQSDKLIPALLP
jgi:nicotinamidase-related amidase